MLSTLLLITIGAFAQKDRIKEAQSLYEKGKSQEALTILNKTEYLILNASDEDKSDYYFLKGNVLKDLAGKNIDAANNFTLASQAYQDVFLYENESGKFKFTIKANLALKEMKSNLVNGAMTDFNAGKFKESAEKSYKVYLFDKKDTLNLFNAASSSVNAKDFDSAIRYYEQLKKINFSGNVHASGGARMMTAAREALLPFGKDAPLLIAVTVLTSMEAEDLRGIGIELSPADYAERLARLTKECGLDGVVCSAHEATRLKASCGQAFKLVTPGIRPAGSSAGDQRRIMTPVEAAKAGVDYMVIGRPITQSPAPAETLREILKSLA